MSAQPAYSRPRYSSAPVVSPSITVVRGKGKSTDPKALPAPVVSMAIAAAVVFVLLALVGFGRVTLTSASASAAIQAKNLDSQIYEARTSGADLEVLQSSLSNPSRIRIKATALGMVEPEVVTSINLAGDIVAVDEQGALSLYGSTQALLAL
ncbi:MAG: cell division protein FtsL [Eggerthellaceae bacterium]|nr:cell division protein FtsL [Eggerthellaceae bacterium]